MTAQRFQTQGETSDIPSLPSGVLGTYVISCLNGNGTKFFCKTGQQGLPTSWRQLFMLSVHWLLTKRDARYRACHTLSQVIPNFCLVCMKGNTVTNLLVLRPGQYLQGWGKRLCWGNRTLVTTWAIKPLTQVCNFAFWQIASASPDLPRKDASPHATPHTHYYCH